MNELEALKRVRGLAGAALKSIGIPAQSEACQIVDALIERVEAAEEVPHRAVKAADDVLAEHGLYRIVTLNADGVRWYMQQEYEVELTDDQIKELIDAAEAELSGSVDDAVHLAYFKRALEKGWIA